MSSLLEAVNVEPNKIEVIDKLPERVGDVSIMILEQLFNALENSNIFNDYYCHCDPGYGCRTQLYLIFKP